MIIMGIGALVFIPAAEARTYWLFLMGIFIQGFVAGLIGIIGVIIGYRLLRSPEMHEIYLSSKSKILKTEIVASETDLSGI